MTRPGGLGDGGREPKIGPLNRDPSWWNRKLRGEPGSLERLQSLPPAVIDELARSGEQIAGGVRTTAIGLAGLPFEAAELVRMGPSLVTGGHAPHEPMGVTKYMRDAYEASREAAGITPGQMAVAELAINPGKGGAKAASMFDAARMAREVKPVPFMPDYHTPAGLMSREDVTAIYGVDPQKGLTEARRRATRLKGAMEPFTPMPPDPAIPYLEPSSIEQGWDYYRKNVTTAAEHKPAVAPLELRTLDGRPILIGESSPAQKTEFVGSWLSPEEVAEFSGWYREVRSLFDRMSHGDPDLADRLLVAGQAMQKNTSPEAAIPAAFEAFLEEAGLLPRLFSKTAEGEVGVRKAGRLAQDTVSRLAQGQRVGTKGMGAKIQDFLDSTFAKSRRQVAGHAKEAGSPYVGDVWMKRFHGDPDDAYLNKIAKEHPELADAVAAVRKDPGYRNTEVPTAGQYEYIGQDGRALRDFWNDIGFMGRNDWSSEEVQAVGWFADRAAVGERGVGGIGELFGFGTKAAGQRLARLAGDAGGYGQSIDKGFVFGSPSVRYGRGLGDVEADTTERAREAIIDQVADAATEVVYGRPARVSNPGLSVGDTASSSTPANVRPLERGYGAWNDAEYGMGYEPSYVLEVTGSPDELRATAALAGKQTRQWAMGTFRPIGEGEQATHSLVKIPVAGGKDAEKLIDGLPTNTGATYLDKRSEIWVIMGDDQRDLAGYLGGLGREMEFSPGVADFLESEGARGRFDGYIREYESVVGREGLADEFQGAFEGRVGAAIEGRQAGGIAPIARDIAPGRRAAVGERYRARSEQARRKAVGLDGGPGGLGGGSPGGLR